MAITAFPAMTPYADTNGVPIVGAKLFYFAAGTTTPKAVYANSGLTVPHPHPIPANAFGRFPQVFAGEGDYKYRVTTAGGSLIEEFDNLAGAPAIVAPVDDTVIGYETGDIKVRFDDQVISGFVRANGKTIGNAASGATERANADTEALFTHFWNRDANHNLLTISGGRGASAAADYAAAKTIALPNAEGAALMGLGNMGNGASSRISVSASLTTVGASATATVASGSGLFAGMYIDHPNVPAGTVINAISGTTITMSAAASSGGAASARFSPFRAYDWMGATAGALYQNLIAANHAPHNHAATTASGGLHNHTASAAVAPDHVHTFTTSTVSDHAHLYQGSPTGTPAGTGGSITVMFPGSNSTSGAGSHNHTGTTDVGGTHTHTVTLTDNGAHTHGVTVDNQGAGQALSVLSPAILVGVYIKL